MKRWGLVLSLCAALMPGLRAQAASGAQSHKGGKSAAKAQWRALCSAHREKRQAFQKALQEERKQFNASLKSMAKSERKQARQSFRAGQKAKISAFRKRMEEERQAFLAKHPKVTLRSAKARHAAGAGTARS